MATKRKRKQPLYSGGDGGSLETAIVIGVTDKSKGIAAEYDYIIEKNGQVDVDWKLISQGLQESEGRHYDIVHIKLGRGVKRSYYFDITQFYGKRSPDSETLAPEIPSGSFRKLIKLGGTRRFLTYSEINDHLPGLRERDKESYDAIIVTFRDMGIVVCDVAPDPD